MKDQVRHLRKRGIKAIAVYSGMTRGEIVIALDNCIYGDYKFLYISPERLATELFITKVRSMRVSMITVDESHCISQWGYDFRPAYLKIADIRKLLPDIPVLAQIKDFAVLVFNNVVSVVCCCEGKLLSRRVVRAKDLHLSTIGTAITRNVQC